MMSLDGLPDQFKEFVERARAALGQEVTAAKNIIAAANAEKASAQAALSDLQAQCKAAQDQLKLTTSEFDRVAALVGVGRDIEKARKELARVKAETTKAEKTLETRVKQTAEADARLVALGNEANRMLGIRAEAETVMSKIRSQLGLVPQ
jgi:chromosome segregation ATPase